MRRFFRILFQTLVLVIVTLASALISMRFAIHGREVIVPNMVGMTPADAERTAGSEGLDLSRGDRFYSAEIPAGRILSQEPEPGTRVRRGWRVQVAESLGPQTMTIPSVLGDSPRAAELNIRRRGLEIGMSAELPVEGAPSEQIIGQSPLPGAQGVASPRVSLLLASAPEEHAFAMPDLTGLPASEANALIAQAGLKAGVSSSVGPSDFVVGQSPAAGQRVTTGSVVELQLGR